MFKKLNIELPYDAVSLLFSLYLEKKNEITVLKDIFIYMFTGVLSVIAKTWK